MIDHADSVLFGEQLARTDDAAFVLELLLSRLYSLESLFGVCVRQIWILPACQQVLGVVELLAVLLLGHDLLSLFEFPLKYYVNMGANLASSVYGGAHAVVDALEVIVEATKLGFSPTMEDGAAHVEFCHGFHVLFLDLAEALLVVLAVHHRKERRRYALDGGRAGLVVDQGLLSERGTGPEGRHLREVVVTAEGRDPALDGVDPLDGLLVERPRKLL